MPKATKPHYVKKNPAAHDAWTERKKNRHNLVGGTNFAFQKWWRQEVLSNRLDDATFTAKNMKELATVFDPESAKLRVLIARAQILLAN